MPDCGLGQVQTVDGARVTVNFEHADKQLIDVAAVPLIDSEPDQLSDRILSAVSRSSGRLALKNGSGGPASNSATARV